MSRGGGGTLISRDFGTFFMKFGEQGFICGIFIAYSIANYLSVNISVLIICIWEESSVYFLAIH